MHIAKSFTVQSTSQPQTEEKITYGLCTYSIVHHPIQQFVAVQNGRRPEQHCVCSWSSSRWSKVHRGQISMNRSVGSTTAGAKKTSHSNVRQRQGEWLPAGGCVKWEGQRISSNGQHVFCPEVISHASFSQFCLQVHFGWFQCRVPDQSHEQTWPEPWADM